MKVALMLTFLFWTGVMMTVAVVAPLYFIPTFVGWVVLAFCVTPDRS